MKVDVAIVGGGPAGLAVAIETTRRSLSALVLERCPTPPDRACGEGILPPGRRALERMGVIDLVPPSQRASLLGVRYLEEGGRSVEARFRLGPGMGARRKVLVEAMARRAAELGAELCFGRAALAWRASPRGVEIDIEGGAVTASLLVLAAGAALSPASRGDRVSAPSSPGRHLRRGMVQHFRLAPWSELVEIYWGERAEAYVTPVSPDEVGVALLWSDDGQTDPFAFDRLMARFPRLERRLHGATVVSPPLSAGPFLTRPPPDVSPRTVLVGDAAGTVDPILGEGLSLSLSAAEALGHILPEAIVAGAPGELALQAYRNASRQALAWPMVLSRALIMLSRHPRVRRATFSAARRWPWSVGRIVRSIAER